MREVLLIALGVCILLFILLFFKNIGKEKTELKHTLADDDSENNIQKVTDESDCLEEIEKIHSGVLRVQTSIIPSNPDDTEGAVI